MQMHECPKFESCSAPICPLDAQWRMRAHNPGDRICFYLREAVKPSADAVVPKPLLAACDALRKAPEIPGGVRRALKRAASHGSRTNQMAHARRAKVIPSYTSAQYQFGTPIA